MLDLGHVRVTAVGYNKAEIPGEPGLRERIILAVLDVLADGDPVVTVVIGPCEINVGWKPGSGL